LILFENHYIQIFQIDIVYKHNVISESLKRSAQILLNNMVTYVERFIDRMFLHRIYIEFTSNFVYFRFKIYFIVIQYCIILFFCGLGSSWF